MPAGKDPKKPKSKGGRPAKYDYPKAQEWFVEGMPVDEDDPEGDRDWPNLRVLSEKTNIPYERLREKAAAERWTDQRRNYQQTVAQERQKKRMELMGRQAIEFDQRGLDVAKIGMQLVAVRMGEIATLVRIKAAHRKDAEERLAAGEAVDRQDLWSAVRADELERLAKAAATLQEIGRRALGQDIEKIAIQGTVTQEHTISVTQELERDDPDRLAAFFAAAQRSGLWQQLEMLESGEEDGEEDEQHGGIEIVDGEVVDDEPQQ